MYARSVRSYAASSFVYTLCLCALVPVCESTLAADIDVPRKHFKAVRYSQCLEYTRKAIEEGAYAADWRILMIESLMAVGKYPESCFIGLSLVDTPLWAAMMPGGSEFKNQR